MNRTEACLICIVALAKKHKHRKALCDLAGGKKRSIPFRRQRMQIDELTPPPATLAYPVPQPDDPYVADLLQMADGRSALPSSPLYTFPLSLHILILKSSTCSISTYFFILFLLLFLYSN